MARVVIRCINYHRYSIHKDADTYKAHCVQEHCVWYGNWHYTEQAAAAEGKRHVDSRDQTMVVVLTLGQWSPWDIWAPYILAPPAGLEPALTD